MNQSLHTIKPVETPLMASLLGKYSINIPRYTSYPTAPEWNERFTKDDFVVAACSANKNKTPVSLYFHLPFCESRCHFCGCNVVISKKREVVSPYIEHIKKEVQLISGFIDKNRETQQIHLGGGTPTYFSPYELEYFFSCIKDNFKISKNCEAGIEVDPRVTTSEHLKTLSSLGFNRLSMGIQDFDAKVQEAVNRVQPFEETSEVIRSAREFGFRSINVDLIYGLPYQKENSFAKTLEKILQLNPDRIALFHFAHLPKLIPHQAKYISPTSLPDSSEKIKIFQRAVKILTENGYVYIGLDHFAKRDDELAISRKNKTLHRNFQGYTTKAGCDLYAFGITAISNIQNIYSQNIKKLNPYYKAIDKDELPIQRGIVLSKDDILRKEVIMKILCHGIITKSEIENTYNINFDTYFEDENKKLTDFEKEGFVKVNKNIIEVTSLGQFFLRNIASVFDFYLNKTNGKQRIFSKSI